MPRTAVNITGVGLVTPLGSSAWATWRAVLAGRCLTDRCANLPDEIDPLTLARAIGAVASVQHAAADPAIELAERAARQAIDAAGVEAAGLAMIVAASKGAVAEIARAPAGPVQRVADGLGERLGVCCCNQVVAACSSSLIGLHLGRQMIRAGEADRVLVVTSEAALLAEFVHSYRRLGVLPKTDPAGYRALPLDRRRSGFVLTEVGAAAVLERAGATDNQAAVPPHAPRIALVDTAVAGEGTDLIRTPADRGALRHIAERLLVEPVDLLHPHATGTAENDASELAVYADVLQRRGTSVADVYACKGALGHGLGSAGLTAVVLGALAHRTGRRPPMPWLADPIDAPLPLRAEAPPAPIDRQAVFAAGFGGHVAGVLLGPA